MEHNQIKKADLKKKSEEQKIPFSNLLAGYVIEELFYLVYDSEFGEELWLKNDRIPGVETYREQQYFSLEFIYHMNERVLRGEKLVPGQRMSKELAEQMFAQIFAKEKNKNIRWTYRYVLTEQDLTAEVTAEFEEMKVPITMHFCFADTQGIIPEKRELTLFVDADRKITYKHYPIETVLAEQLFQIMEMMELIPSMRPYDMVYEIISKDPVDGRHVRETLSELCSREGFSCQEERMDMGADYIHYVYMKKRWEKYEKQRKKEQKTGDVESIEWEKVMQTVTNFLRPIWYSISRDEVFFGDWMPELGRYLD